MTSMNRTCRLLVLIVLPDFAGGGAAQAQKADAPPPAPYVVNAPEVSGWTVAFTFRQGIPEPADKGSPAYAQWQQWRKSSPAIAEVLVSKSHGRERVVTKLVSGSQSEQYMAGAYLFLQKPGLAAGDIVVAPSPVQNGDFPELAWLSETNYADTESSNGKRCYVFKEASSGREAWIDAATLLPHKFNDALYDRIYDFSSAPIGIEPSEPLAKRAALYPIR